MGEVTVLSIGTTHPWNVAGVGLDARVGAELDTRVLTVVAGVSAQDARGLHALHVVPPVDLEAQLAAIPWELVDAVRVGALGAAACVTLVADALARLDVPVVVDPVIATSLGGDLTDEQAVQMISERFCALGQAIVTPNLAEAGVLLGRPVERASMADAAQALRSRGARAVLLKGGHLDGNPADVLATAQAVTVFEEPRIAGRMRGTGCVLAMSLACALARGDELGDAVAFARGFVREKIAHAVQFGRLSTAY